MLDEIIPLQLITANLGGIIVNLDRDHCHRFGFRTGGNQSDWPVTKAQVHQCRVEHKHINVGWNINITYRTVDSN